MSGLLLGCIADDFTGATDLANMLVRAGMRTVQTIGVPRGADVASDADAIVVALKSRTIPAREAVAQSLAALEWLRARGARQFYFKYCSTFDSTDEGNIGPVADALLDALGADLHDRVSRVPRQQPDDLPGAPVRRRYAALGIADARPSADADARLRISCVSLAARRNAASVSCRGRSCSTGPTRSASSSRDCRPTA